jgi:hypothetical protein
MMLTLADVGSIFLQVRVHPARLDTPTAVGCHATLEAAVYHRHVASSMLVSHASCIGGGFDHQEHSML